MTLTGDVYTHTKKFQLHLIFVTVRCTWAIFHGVVKTWTNPIHRTRICVSVTQASKAKTKIKQKKKTTTNGSKRPILVNNNCFSCAFRAAQTFRSSWFCHYFYLLFYHT